MGFQNELRQAEEKLQNQFQDKLEDYYEQEEQDKEDFLNLIHPEKE